MHQRFIAPLAALAVLAFVAPAAWAQGVTQPTEPSLPPPAAAEPAPPAASTPTPDGAPACRTSRAPGEPCACLSDTSRIGEAAQTRADGPVMCVVPAATGEEQGDQTTPETPNTGAEAPN